MKLRDFVAKLELGDVALEGLAKAIDENGAETLRDLQSLGLEHLTSCGVKKIPAQRIVEVSKIVCVCVCVGWVVVVGGYLCVCLCMCVCVCTKSLVFFFQSVVAAMVAVYPQCDFTD